MDAADLKVFEAVARLGGMNRAANELHTVQSNVTARVRLLEERLGRALFERHSRGVVLTQAGHRLLPYAERVRLLLQEARRAVEDDGAPKGLLTLGSLETTAALRLPPILTAYAASYPDVDLVLGTGMTRGLTSDVLEHRLEGAFVCGPVRHPDLNEEVIFREELVIFTAPSVRSLDQLAQSGGLRLVTMPTGCAYRQRLEEILAKRGIVGLRVLEFGTLEAIFGCVAAGLGVTLLPKSLTSQVWCDRRVAVHELPGGDAHVETVFIRRRDTYVSSALKAFLRFSRPAPVRVQAAE